MNNQAENDFVKNNLQGNMVFIGYNDMQSEGTGAWSNGEPVSLDLSYNNNSTNDFAVMNFWAGTWQMEQPGPWRKYVMEKACGSNPINLPDLTVSNIANLPSSGEPMTQVDFNFNLNNIGNATAAGNYNVNMYLSTDATYSSNDVLVGNVPTGGTPVGTIANIPASILIPTIADGNYHLIIFADSDTDITESNENNNTVSTPFTVSSGGGVGSCGAMPGYTKLSTADFNGHGYYMSNDTKPWSLAKTLAESAGGYLVTMNSQAENDYVKNHLQNNMVFIGYNDMQTEGTGAWANGAPVSLDLSYGNTATNDFAVMNFWAGTWQMEQAGPWRKYIMERSCAMPIIAMSQNRMLQVVSVYPNPAINRLTANLKIEEDGEVCFSILNAQGQVQLVSMKMLSKGAAEVEFDIHTLETGMYFLSVTGADVNQVIRFVKAN